MKKVLVFSFIAAFAFSLIFPGGKIFGDGRRQLKADKNQAAPGPPSISVRVVQLPQIAEIKPISHGQRPILPLDCPSAAKPGKDLVQSAGLINFNQPAECFVIRQQKDLFAETELGVKPLALTLPQIKIGTKAPDVTGPRLATAPFASTAPMLPLAVFAVYAGHIFFRRKKAVSGKFMRAQAKNDFTFIGQLQILRC